MKKIFAMMLAGLVMAACEQPLGWSDVNGSKSGGNGNVTLQFTATNDDAVTRAATMNLGLYFQKLNVQIFDAQGEKVWQTMKTQTAGSDGFGSLTCQLAEGTYTVVGVGHSSIKSATIKSPQMIQFTASDGEKLTDTFSCCSEIEVGNDELQQTFQMQRVAAMVQFKLTDKVVPETFDRLVIAYTGGSANFNPSTLEGTTKSTQSETRQRSDTSTYQVFTFPYQAAAGTLKMTLTAYDDAGNTLRQRVFEHVPVARNRITTYRGQFFDGTEGSFTQAAFGFSVNGDWEGEDQYQF